jgi:ATP-dependent RNA helicase SUPV3L1/SUV3
MTFPEKQFDPLILSGRDVTAVLGPTNTGKTHLAIERMVAHESGVIGLPLRLLAREVYGRVCEKVGANKVALITGEEKIVPIGAKYSVCTVEAMPRESDAAFVAIDEVQLAGDLERGHIFTDRLLHLRGRQETLLLGAATMRGPLERLLKGISVVTRPRLSHLAYAGQKKITRLPARSAIVAFSADEVYAIGELIRRQRGGVAVVLGALSPRTRNAQVALYQSGDVDYIVATDAIGMGLNLDVDHVAFAQNRKFDGYQYRQLNAGELGQIAGRAGRHMRDGTFGVTGQVDPFDEDIVRKLEAHDFDPVKVLQWRTAQFDYTSLDGLKRSIETNAPVEGLTRAPPAVDQQALEFLSQQPEIRDLAKGRERVALLWEACALPDYRKIAPAQHSDIIASIYIDLVRRGHVDENYLSDQVRRADSVEGDIDTLSHRIAQIRTWTFVSNRPGWLADPTHWQQKTREIEDRLSDALHERLTKRFVDRRTSVLTRRLRENAMLDAEISPAGTVTVEGHHVGELQGFRFTADQTAAGEDAKAVRTAAQKALATEFEARAEKFATAGNSDFALASDGMLRWIGAPVGTLAASEDALKPRVILLADEQLTGAARDKVAARAERYVHYQIESQLKPLVDLKGAEQLTGIAKGIAFRLVENFGLINRRDIADDVKALDQEGRAALRRLGVRFGAYHIFIPALIKPAPASLVTLLWALQNDGKDKQGFGDVVHALATGRTSVLVNATFDPAFYRLAGYRVLGRRAVRVDILERLADLIRPALSWRAGTGKRPDGAFDGAAFIVTPPMMSILGATADDIEEILKGLGYRAEPKPAAEIKAKLEALDESYVKAEVERLAKAEAAKAAAKAAKAEAEAAAEPAEAGQPEAGEMQPTEAIGEAAGPVAEAAAEAPGDAVEDAIALEAVPAEAEAGITAEAVEEAAVAEAFLAEDSDDAASDEPAPEPASPPEAEAATSADDATTEAAPAETPTAEAASRAAEPEAEAAEAPKPILLWRPARLENRPRHHHRDNRQRGREQGQQHGQRRDAAPREGGETSPDGKQRFERRFKGKHGDSKGKHGGNGRQDEQQPRGGKPDHRGKHQGKPNFQQKPREERPVRFDPDSPFAKLAALRDQLRK